jgi:Ser/Thr protein kinase RdoA (MazF antagonist)
MNSTDAEDASTLDVNPWEEGTTIPEAVRQAFPALSGSLQVRMLSTGLIHRTLHIRGERGEYVLQRVSDVFAPEIHDNIDAVTRHLKAHGFRTFELLPTHAGERSIDVPGEGRWRLLTHLEGVCFERIQSEAQARSAGSLVGGFHSALDDFDAQLAPMGIPMRNTALYLERLHVAVEAHSKHRLVDHVRAAAAQIEAALAALGPPLALPERVIHGDLKLANFLFEGAGPPARDQASALIDLDTLMRAPLWSEWGDAWRSWCNRPQTAGQDTGFDLGVFEASLHGYVEGYGQPLSATEKQAFATATERITLELCVRFATDILEESYFAWDETQYETAGDHNVARVRNQLAFFEATSACRRERVGILEALS